MTNMRPPNKTILLKVVILGDGGVGKSCLMNRFVSNRYDENNFHTIGVEFMNKDIEVDGEKYTLQIWDTAGQERFRALRTPFYRGSDVCILCYAIDDRDSFRGLKQWRNEFLSYADVNVEKFPFIVIGNKNDVLKHQRQISFDEVQEWCQENSITSQMETSSKTATNVNEAFVLAVRQWKHLERQAEAELRAQNETISLTRPIRLVQNRICCSGATNTKNNNNLEDDYMESNRNQSSSPSSNRFGFRKNPKNYSTNFQL